MTNRTKFAVIGINHNHIFGMTSAVLRGGGELAAFYAIEDDLAADFSAKYPNVRRVSDKAAILEDSSIALVLSAGIPSERARLGIEVMECGKDYFCDKAAFIHRADLAEARRVQAETGRIFSICYSERVLEPGAWRAGELVKAGAIGRVLHVAISAPHILKIDTRPSWFFERKHFGGILTDIGSHQIEQFLYFAGIENAEIVGAQTANYAHPNYPEFEDFGAVMLRGYAGGETATGYAQVDWLVPEGGGRTARHRTLLGTEGVLEIEHSSLTLTTSRGTRRIECADAPSDFGRLLVSDVQNRTETAMNQKHCFHASEVTLLAQEAAAKNSLLPFAATVV